MKKDKTRLSAEESALFRQHVTIDKKIHTDRTTHKKSVRRQLVMPPDAPVPQRLRYSHGCAPEVSADTQLTYRASGLNMKTWKALTRGKLALDASLDLHGCTVEQALTALEEFLHYAKQHQLRVLHIVHGKGFRSQPERPKLKNLVYRVLLELPNVLAFTSAPAELGGKGAVLILMRRMSAGEA